jgi:DNA-binding response OmpR family regulator
MVDNKKRVLVVDDEPRILHFVRVNLNLSGYDVITTTSGEEALRLLESEKPDIMLLDILMTPMSGFDVLSQLRTFSRLPVVVFTGRDDIAATAMREGADDYIAKPFRPEELTKKINNILEKTETPGEQLPSTARDERKA